ncbi:MAG: PH domain-containing protein [Idiomarina sp.]
MPDFDKVSPKYPNYLRSLAWLNTLGIIIALGVISHFASQLSLTMAAAIAGLVVLITLVLHFWWLPRRYELTGYCVDENQLQLRKGALWRTRQAAAMNRIQHSEVSQGPIERAFGLSRLIVYTAGGAGADISIPGLADSKAEQLKALVLQQIMTEQPADPSHD